MKFFLSLMFIMMQALAEEPVAKPEIKKLADGKLQLAEIVFSPVNRSVSIPCKINLLDDPLEFALCHESGKLHESLLSTTVSPIMLNTVLKLLKYPESHELYAEEISPGKFSDKFPQVSEEVSKAARVTFTVEFEKDGKKVSLPLNDCITHTVTTKTIPASEPWIYGGSIIRQGKFLAEQTGDLISISLSRGSLFLYNGTDKNNDDVWQANRKILPPVGTSATLTIQPLQ